jgi:hypothetical protein
MIINRPLDYDNFKILVVKLYFLEHTILLLLTNLETLADQKRSADRTLGNTVLQSG